jgi:toxin-antitoxin system PIN domain toxin
VIIPDLNLLVYAYNRADQNHPSARSWWESSINAGTPIGLSWIVVSGFIRIMTHSRVLEDPMPTAMATATVRTWLKQPSVLVLEPGERFAAFFLQFIEDLGTGGNLTTDAFLAALTIENQAELHSNDADFSRFKGLRWTNPLNKRSPG